MIHVVVSVKDKVAEAFLPPMVFQNVPMALRALRDAAVDGTHMFARNKRDYSLYRLGSFDDTNGIISVLPEPEFVVSVDGMFPPEG
jgi:hypothetical protein